MKRYALVGTGQRGCTSYLWPMTELFQDCALLVGVYDKNKARATYASSMAAYEVPVYDEFHRMIHEGKPDTVIVTTLDAAHDDYAVAAMEAGCDVILEKPLTTDEFKLRRIYDARLKTQKNVVVTFNCRFMPIFMRVKELLNEGVIGDVFSAHYEWMLDTDHGADYFRRWHRERKNSGSLLIHKSTHHFDLLNWLIDDIPVKVNAFGSRRFYGENGFSGGENCRNCTRHTRCPFHFDLEKNPLYQALYASCEGEDGYLRDGCVFSKEIDIEDTVSLNIRYQSGISAAYSLTAHSPYEGLSLILNGREGRLELSHNMGDRSEIRVFNRFGEKVVYHIPEAHITKTMREIGQRIDATGGHGGSDAMLREALFRGQSTDPLGQMADFNAGAYSACVGIAANISLREDRAVALSEFMEYLQ